MFCTLLSSETLLHLGFGVKRSTAFTQKQNPLNFLQLVQADIDNKIEVKMKMSGQ